MLTELEKKITLKFFKQSMTIMDAARYVESRTNRSVVSTTESFMALWVQRQAWEMNRRGYR